MRKYLLLVFLSLFIGTLCAQTDVPEVDAYLEKAKALNISNQDSALYYSKKAYSYALKTKDTLLIGQVGYYHSFYHIKKGNYIEADSILQFNLTNATKMNSTILGGTHSNYGNMHYMKEVYDLAIERYLKSIGYYKEANNKTGLMRSNLQLGVIYSKLNKKEIAGYFYEESLAYSENAEKKHTTKITYGDNSAPRNIEVSKAMLKELEQEPNNVLKAYVLYNLGKSFVEAKQWQNALQPFQQSMAVKKQIGLADQIDRNLFYIGQSYLELGNYDDAIHYLNQAQKASNKRTQKASIEGLLQQAYEKKGDYKTALQYAKRYERMKDSINALQESDRIAEITSQFETEKQAAEIELLATNNALQATKLSKQQAILWSTIIGIALLLVTLFFGYKRYQAKQKLQFSEMTRKLLQMQLNPHFLFNALNGIQFFIKQNDTKKSTKYISNFSGLMRNILENSVEKFISVEEDAETIIDFLALQQLVHNNSFLFSVHIEDTLDAENLCIPPMFTQPFVENAIIHGVQGVTNGTISVRYGLQDNAITVEIKDNGKGIVASSKHANSLHKSMGTSITKQRMENLLKTENYPVTLEVISQNEPDAQQGTTVMLTFQKKYL